MEKPIFCFLVCIVFFSCNREPVPPPAPTNTIRYLKQVDIQDSVDGYTHKLNVYYDASDRVIKMTFDSKMSVLYTPSELQFFTDSFFYNGTDTLPWKIETAIYISGQTTHYTSLLSYNTTGQKIKDSVLYDNGVRTSITKRIYRRGVNYLVDAGYQDSIVFANGNMQETFRKNSSGLLFDIIYDSVDNNINPYSKLNIAEAFFKRHIYFSDDWVINARQSTSGHFNMQALNSNNMVKWRLLNYVGGTPPWPWYYASQYTYNADGYPLTQDLTIREGTETGRMYNHLRYTYTYY